MGVRGAAGLYPQLRTTLCKARQPPSAPPPIHQLILLIPFDCCTLLKKKKGLKLEEDVEEPSLVVSYALWLQSTEKAELKLNFTHT